MKYLPGLLDPFISPITGRLRSENQLPTLETNYVWLGDRNNNAFASPVIIDVRLDIIELRTILDKLLPSKFILQTKNNIFKNSQALDELDDGILKHIKGVIDIATPGTDFLSPDLLRNNIFIGDNDNKAFPNQRINNINLPPFTKVIQLDKNPIFTTILLSTVKVYTSNTENLSVGDIVKIKGASDVGGITADKLNIFATITSIDSGNSFSYVSDGIATSTVNGGGGTNVSYYFPQVASNYGIYNLYTGGIINKDDFLNDPGPVASTTLRIHQSNLPNLRKARMLIGAINSTQPNITINTNPPYFHVNSGDLNWDSRGENDNNYGVPIEIGLNAYELFTGKSDNSGDITTTTILDISNMANLKLKKIWRGDEFERPKESDDLTNLENRVDELENRVTDLETRVTEIEAEIVEIQGEIAAIQTELLAIQAEIVEIQAQVTTLAATVAGLVAAVAALTLRVTALENIVHNLRLAQFVVGGPPDSTGLINTFRGPTCLLTNIPAGGDVSMDNYRITNLETFSASTWEEMESKQLDAINFLFLWQLLGGGTR